MSRVYILNDYEEYGPTSIRAAATPAGIIKAFDEVTPEGTYQSERTKLLELLEINQPCSINLGRGWGGYQLHIVELEP